MPTGYTAELMDKGMDFNSFVLQCARAFGALIMMRDDPSDALIPEKFEPSDSHIKSLKKVRKKHDVLSAMTNNERIIFGQAEKDKVIKHTSEWLERDTVQNERLSEMLLQVMAWKPPTQDHEELKKFMVDQIKISMNDLGYVEKALKEAKEKSPMTFCVAAVSFAAWSIKYHTEENLKEIERAESRTRWVKQLRVSLGIT